MLHIEYSTTVAEIDRYETQENTFQLYSQHENEIGNTVSIFKMNIGDKVIIYSEDFKLWIFSKILNITSLLVNVLYIIYNFKLFTYFNQFKI